MTHSIRPPLPGDPARIAGRRVVGRLGAGGMGTVYAVLDDDGRRLAVKTVHPQFAADPEFRSRFRREVAVLRRVSGPCLVPFVDADPDAEVPWLVTEYAPGETLDGWLAAHGPLTGARLALFAAGTAAALAAVHAAGVVHRDLKPANVILSPEGPRVLDFGIAHVTGGTAVTRTGFTTGTPGWISPEQYRDGLSTARGDVFAWGALIAHAAHGRPVFGVGAPDAVAFRVLGGEPDLDGVPAELRELVAACLAKDPADRPDMAEAARRTLTLAANAGTTTLPVPGSHPTDPTDHEDAVRDATHTADTEAGARPATVVDSPAPGPAPAVAAFADLPTAGWAIPVPEDPAWTAPPAAPATPARAGRNRIARVLVVCAVLGALIGGGAALLPGLFGPKGTDGSTDGGADRARGPASSAPAAPGPSASASGGSGTPGPALTKTTEHTLAPWEAGQELSAGITVASTRPGSCWTTALRTARPDAWRCGSDSEILDPCFSSFPDGLLEKNTAVLCLGSDPRSVVRLDLTEPLPADSFRLPDDGTPTAIVAIELADGTTCSNVVGKSTDLAAKRLDYLCEGEGKVYGGLDTSKPVWTVNHQAKGAASAVTTPVRAVYR
ncbi:serine/threonine-protein kinase [Streptomyces sp. BI20]|uniref:serine/threonine-protein kinase n=1 Tax=Streptomyces sp. BI20 TaxID=3403460 RepID=UPI003C7843C3